MVKIDELERLGLGGKGFYYLRKPVLFPAMLHSVGHSRETEPRYDFDGLTRTTTDMALFQYTLAGRGRLTYEGTSYTLEPGQAMLLHFPHANRYWLPADWPPWEFLFVAVRGGELLRLWPQLERRTGPVVAMAHDSKPVRTAVGIFKEALGGGIQSSCEASALAYRFVMELFDELVPETPKSPRPTFVEDVLEYCHGNLDKPIGVREMAAASGYSRYHFTRLFQAAEGLSPARYLMMLRMERAVQLLREDERKPIAKIAKRCGFNNVDYFCKVFRKATGLSPGAFASQRWEVADRESPRERRP
ncbi:MAG: AraC family transcriptional regulator [Kiritimatiellae bacterium]|nr:AraC family transcriptional regulator [Kiritimatiellia bacterium]